MIHPNYRAKTPDTYVSPLPAGVEFDFVSSHTIYPYDGYNPIGKITTNTYIQDVFDSTGVNIFHNQYDIIYDNGSFSYTRGEDVGYKIKLLSGVYKVVYSFRFKDDRQGNIGNYITTTATYEFQVVQNQYPLRKQTIKEVIERILRLTEPLVWNKAKGEYVKPPRFLFGYKYSEDSAEGKAERALFEQTSPEFTFTRCTLREALQQIGQFIHAEPRLVYRVIDGKRKMVWIFDRYGEGEQATYTRAIDGVVAPLNQHPYKAKRFSHDVGVACTQVESDVDNFVNRLDKKAGTIAEPYLGGALTLRTEQAYLRFEDGSDSGTGGLYFPTTREIMDISEYYWVDFDGLAGTVNARYRITPYVFEKTIYDADLSSYDSQYPRSKSYALYFTQGQKNIGGFWFKNEEWSDGVFANYAIVNILEQVTGVNNLRDKLTDKYPTLAFELVYAPTYGARISHGKSYLGDYLKKPFTLMYNQSANIVETRYYGEHVKGVAERLGNIDKNVDIIVRNANNIPKIGQKWDEDYYIATVKSSVVYDGILINIGLSKKFNRLSEYVGANSYKRYYEVSERMAQDRRPLYKDYLVITENEGGIVSDACGIWTQALTAVANSFYQNNSGLITEIRDDQIDYVGLQSQIVNLVQSTGYGKDFSPNTSVFLSATSSAFGNCMEFTWDFKDNYSAGVSSVYQTGQKASGYFGAEVAYTDYYGRMYYQQWTLGEKAFNESGQITLERALALPRAFEGGIYGILGVNTGGFDQFYHVVDKDNREILKQGYAIEYVTDIKDIVIGSALARSNPMIGGVVTDNQGNSCYAELYVLPNRVNQFANDQLDLSEATLVYSFIESSPSPTNSQIKLISNTVEGTKGEHYLRFEGTISPISGKAWAIVTRRYRGEAQTVEGDDGNPVTIIPNYGGEVLIAKNTDINSGDVVGKFNIIPTHDIFDLIKKEE